MSEPEVSADAVVASPLGPIGLRLQDGLLAALWFAADGTPEQPARSPAAAGAVREIEAYFADPGHRLELPLLPQGSPFQRRVWQALRGIPAGQVVTYGELARRLESSPRAVGGACRANPWPLLVPCHRVVAAHGPGGYAGATAGRWMAIKTRLLRHEGVIWPA